MANMINELGLESITWRLSNFECDKALDRLAFKWIRLAYYACLSYCWMAHQSAFDISRTNTVSGNVHNIIVATNDRDIAIFIH